MTLGEDRVRVKFNPSARTTGKVRAVVVTTDGKRYLTPRWYRCAVEAHNAADRLAARRRLEVRHINVQVQRRREEARP